MNEHEAHGDQKDQPILVEGHQDDEDKEVEVSLEHTADAWIKSAAAVSSPSATDPARSCEDAHRLTPKPPKRPSAMVGMAMWTALSRVAPVRAVNGAKTSTLSHKIVIKPA